MADEVKNIGLSTKLWATQNDRACFFKDEDESTNSTAKAATRTDASPVLFLTNHQTQGRGRGANTWDNSRPGDCLLASWRFTLPSPAQHIAGPVVGLTLFQTAQQTWPSLAWSLKPPNDLYLGNKKVAGLLMESILQGSQSVLVVGLGFNVLSAPAKIETATFLTSDDGLGGPLSTAKWHEFLDRLDANWQSMIPRITQSSLKAQTREQLIEAINLNPNRSGLVVDVTADGNLVMDGATVSWKDL